jgi:hypothetical protein
VNPSIINIPIDLQTDKARQQKKFTCFISSVNITYCHKISFVNTQQKKKPEMTPLSLPISESTAT